MVQILSKSMDEAMPLTMRIKKRLHFLICCWCQRYEEQLHYLRKTAAEYPNHVPQSSGKISDEIKKRWKEALRPS